MQAETTAGAKMEGSLGKSRDRRSSLCLLAPQRELRILRAMETLLEQLNSVLLMVTATLASVTAVVGAAAALLRQVKRLREGAK